MDAISAILEVGLFAGTACVVLSGFALMFGARRFALSAFLFGCGCVAGASLVMMALSASPGISAPFGEWRTACLVVMLASAILFALGSRRVAVALAVMGAAGGFGASVLDNWMPHIASLIIAAAIVLSCGVYVALRLFQRSLSVGFGEHAAAHAISVYLVRFVNAGTIWLIALPRRFVMAIRALILAIARRFQR